MIVADRSRQRSSARKQEEETGGICLRSGTGSLPRRSKSNVCNGQTTAPVQAPPRVTVREKDGSPTLVHDGEIGARRDVLVTFLGSRGAFFGNRTSASQAKTWTPPETPVKYKAEDAQWAVAQLSSGKAGPCIRSGGPVDRNKVWTAWSGCRETWLDAACAGHPLLAMDRGCGQRHRVVHLKIA